MLFVYAIFLILLLVVVYRALTMAIPVWIAQANDLERRFGRDVRAAAKYHFTGQDNDTDN